VTLGASSLLAKGVGIPTAVGGQGTPLPDEVILDPNEIATIKAHVDGDNQAIKDICQAAGIPVVDINGILKDIAQNGRNVGGVKLTASFLTGGIFSYDGVHPSDLGYAIVANEWISKINSEAGGSLPAVNLGPFVGTSLRRGASLAPPPSVEFDEEAWRNLLAIFGPVDRRN
jgi:hypothetical protein